MINIQHIVPMNVIKVLHINDVIDRGPGRSPGKKNHTKSAFRLKVTLVVS